MLGLSESITSINFRAQSRVAANRMACLRSSVMGASARICGRSRNPTNCICQSGDYASSTLAEAVTTKIHAAKVTDANIKNVIRFIPRITNLKDSEIAAPTRVIRDPEDPSTVLIDIFNARYRLVVRRLLKSLQQNNFVQPYNWGRWQLEAAKYLKRRKSLETASLETCIKLLTLHIRKERFCTGHFGAMIKAGHIQKILKRLAVLTKAPTRIARPQKIR